MKKTIVITALMCLLSLSLFSQEQDKEEFKTLLGHERHNGFYGALTVGYSEIESRPAINLGGRFEWISGRSLGIGLGGTGFINENHHDPILNSEVFLAGGYGGIYVEPILMPNYPVHVSFPVLFGGGGIAYLAEQNENNHDMVQASRGFLILEPAIEIELNLTRNFRLAIGGSYRFTTPFEVGTSSTVEVNSGALRGFTCMMTFKFGKF